MIDFTPIARLWFRRRADAMRRAADAPERTQCRVLQGLLRQGRRTEYGQSVGLDGVRAYADFAARVPIVEYEQLRPLVMRMVQGAPDVLWPGRCRRFAQSSGTSGGKSKYIPITPQALSLNHYGGASDALAAYLQLNPRSRLFSGRSFILGGSYANALHLPPGVRVGDLSASLIDCINPLVNLVRVPSKATALMEDWTAKLPALVREASRANVTNISGVPSWFLSVLRGILAQAGAESIHDVWPRLEVFFHGGIAFGPYQQQYRAITSRPMHYIENYNASEGFFAFQDTLQSKDMLLLLDRGIFFELLPLAELGSPSPQAIPVWEARAGRDYALIITAPNGLWRYLIGDTVRVTSTDPLRVLVSGRTQHFINAFGEELMVYNADRAIESACRVLGCAVANYTAAPLYATAAARGRHQWLIEWATPPADPDAFVAELDRRLQDENSDYQAKRSGGIFLDPPLVVTARPGLFDAWLAATGKLGGQRKVPRLRNDRSLIDPLLALNVPAAPSRPQSPKTP